MHSSPAQAMDILMFPGGNMNRDTNMSLEQKLGPQVDASQASTWPETVEGSWKPAYPWAIAQIMDTNMVSRGNTDHGRHMRRENLENGSFSAFDVPCLV